jgi:hypothetical protein
MSGMFVTTNLSKQHNNCTCNPALLRKCFPRFGISISWFVGVERSSAQIEPLLRGKDHHNSDAGFFRTSSDISLGTTPIN